ncbi:NAD+ synthase [Rhizobium aethiopicum]|uniref:NH(3)-dependent NAD(+) synthetase n=1 Tax=Rhizobium aethiopicum TaxID=1138170 RepID=A0A7W6MJH4_9HYPH|nr:NAD(+) synthase [Rhizobium aethiopicum]MBB4193032.1 NAD+ synthase [Rhizobium aethiopicum]MBB4579293.1 NAD+ synthase [Rhizobium aethiopicum]
MSIAITEPKPPASILEIDCAAEADRIAAEMRGQLRAMKKRGLVVGLSGGIDSSVCAALAVKAVGAKNVLALLMPEHDSETDSGRLGRRVADLFGIECIEEDIAPALAALGCYERRDRFIRQVVSDYCAEWRSKVVIADLTSDEGFRLSSLVVEDPDGNRSTYRLPISVYLGIVAATSMKQRTRKQIEYFHADRLNFAVLGTPNRLEFDQGFFVKNGDGAADLKPIAHLYKTQVYALAAALGIPDEILNRPPTTDTYSLAQTQEEFYFSVPYAQMDICLYGLNNGLSSADIGVAAGLTSEQVERVWRDIVSKRKSTAYLHARPQLAGDVAEVP